MPTVFILGLFSLVFTIMAAMISNGTSNVAVLNKNRTAETYKFFEQIAQVATDDITNTYYNANPNNAANPVAYIAGLSEMKRLYPGRLSDPTLDAWGQPIRGVIFTEYQSFSTSTDTNNNVMLPVTGFALVSSGPDRILDTTIPSSVTKLSDVYGVVVSSTIIDGKVVTSDDIVYTFDNRNAQQRLLDSVKMRLNRIGTASLKSVQTDLAAYRQKKLADYQTLIASGKDVSMTSVVDISSDPNAPKMGVLDNSTKGLANRQKIGVDEDFRILEAAFPNGGKFQVTSSSPTTPSDPMQIILQNSNETTTKTPWGKPGAAKNFRYQITIQAVSSSLAI